MKLLPDLLLYILLMIISSFFIFFFLVFFPVLSPSPLKKKTLRFLFRQPARPFPNAQLLSSASSPVSRYANFL